MLSLDTWVGRFNLTEKLYVFYVHLRTDKYVLKTNVKFRLKMSAGCILVGEALRW
jgi:hypothetical protein